MSWVAVAVGVGGAVIGGISANNAADTQAEATGQASALQNQAANRSIDLQEKQYSEGVARQQPFLDAGTAGINKLQTLLGIGPNTGAAGYGSLNTPFKFDGSSLASDPGYQFQLQQGQNALDRKQAAGGGFYSGAGLQQASALNQGLASTAFNDAYTRQANQFQTDRANQLNPLLALSDKGQLQANQVNNLGSNFANSASGLLTGNANAQGSLLTNNANAQGAAGIAGANALNSGINNGLTAWQRQSYINQINQPQYGYYNQGQFMGPEGP